MRTYESSEAVRREQTLCSGAVPQVTCCAAALAVVEQLEARNTELTPTASPSLLGSWALDFTDAADVLSLRLVPAELGQISQDVRAGPKPGVLLATNAVEVRPLLSSALLPASVRPVGRYAVEAVCEVLDDARVSPCPRHGVTAV